MTYLEAYCEEMNKKNAYIRAIATIKMELRYINQALEQLEKDLEEIKAKYEEFTECVV